MRDLNAKIIDQCLTSLEDHDMEELTIPTRYTVLRLSQALSDRLRELELVRYISVRFTAELDAPGGEPTGRQYVWLSHCASPNDVSRQSMAVVDKDQVDGVSVIGPDRAAQWAESFVRRFIRLVVRSSQEGATR